MFVLFLLLATWLLSQHVNKEKLHWLELLLFIIFCMQGIYTYIPETNRVSREYSVAATQ